MVFYGVMDYGRLEGLYGYVWEAILILDCLAFYILLYVDTVMLWLDD